MDHRRGEYIDNRYLLKEHVGSGSFGEVWLTEDTLTGQDLAIKLYISLDDNGLRQFLHEHEISRNLKHVNLLPINHVGTSSRVPYLLMRYCSRGSATALVGNATEKEIWKFIHDVSNGLSYLHAQTPTIIHQDIKPANILLDGGSYVITDFGTSRNMRDTMRRQSTRSLGSPAYMAPEKFLEHPMVIKEGDIWSLGVSIYELATGELPFMGYGGGMLNGHAAMPNLDKNKYSDNLNRLMRQCLDKDPQKRPTAKDLVVYADKMLADVPPPMPVENADITFSKAVVDFFNKYAEAYGRASRAEFWYAQLFCAMVTGFFGLVALLAESEELFFVMWGMFATICLSPTIAIIWRRLHDINLSGGWFFLILAPGYGLIALIIMLSLPSAKQSRF